MEMDWISALYASTFFSRLNVKEIPELHELGEELRNAVEELLPSGGRILLVGGGIDWVSNVLSKNLGFEIDLVYPKLEQNTSSQSKNIFLNLRERCIEGFPPFGEKWNVVFIPDGVDLVPAEQRARMFSFLKEYTQQFVLVGLFNPRNYWYWVWRLWGALYGQGELPLTYQTSLEQDLTSAGLPLLAQSYLGTSLTNALVNWINGIQNPVRQLIEKIHQTGVVPRDQSALYRVIMAGAGPEVVFSSDSKYWKSYEKRAETEENLQSLLTAVVAMSERSQNQAQRLIDSLQEQVNFLSRKNRELQEEVSRYKSSPVWWLSALLYRLRQAVLPSGGRIVQRLNRLWLAKKIRRFVFRNPYAELMQILREHSDAKGVIVFPPSIEWKATLYQRPQHLAMAFAREGYLVFYCQPEYAPAPRGFTKLAPRLYLSKVEMKFFANISNPIVIFYPYNREYLSYFVEPKVIYEYIDELEVFSRPLGELQANHHFFLQNADIVIATADSLLEQVKPLRPDALLVPNGVDFAHFEQTWKKQAPPPSDLVAIVRKNSPIVGYYGALARWFDYDLLKKLAQLRPDLSFVLIGPDYDGTLQQAHLEQFPNIFWLGKKDYAALPDYLRYFDVCMIPFVVNKITHSTSPLKLFEYLAARKPVVVTPMRESMKIEGVLVAGTPQQFSEQIDQALSLGKSTYFQELATRVALQNIWEVRAQTILCRLNPSETGPEFRYQLQVYVQQISEGMPQETKKLWYDFANSTIVRGINVASRLSQIMDFRGKSFLDVGCAYGGFLVAFAHQGCSRVVGIDVNQDLLNLAAINLREKGVQGDLYRLNVESPEFLNLGLFDLITCNDVIEHVSNPQLALKQMATVLKPGGWLYMEIPNPFWYEFLVKDGHYNLPGITLLSPQDAEAYFRTQYSVAYGVNEYHLLGWYLDQMEGLGMKVSLLNDSLLEPQAVYQNLKLAVSQMNKKLTTIHTDPVLVEKIQRRAKQLLHYVERRLADPAQHTYLSQTFGTSFWTLLARKSI